MDRKIRAVFDGAGTALGPKDILSALDGDMSYDALRKRLSRMVQSGSLNKNDRGKYAM